MRFNRYFNELQAEIEAFNPPKPYGEVTPQTILEATAQDGFFSMTGGDEIRSAFVDFQYLTELVATKGLHSGVLDGAVNVMHTPKPATPLLSDGSSSNIVLTDAKYTVKNRSELLVDFMQAGGFVKTFFPQDFDWGTLSEKQKSNFQGLYNLFSPDIELLDKRLVVGHFNKLSNDQVGATAFYYPSEEYYPEHSAVLFSIQGQQADETSEKTWSVWLGHPLDNDVIRERKREFERLTDSDNLKIQDYFRVPTL